MVYLDNAATSFPKPPRVYEQLRSYLEEYGACPGRGSYEMARQAEALIEQVRQVLAELFHVGDPRRIVLTLNATDALNMAIKGALRPGDHVITTVLEHNSVARPLNRLERKGLIRVTRVGVSREGFVDPEEIREAVTDRTRLVAVVHGSNAIGSLQPIAAIGPIVRQRDALFLVDASQTAGAVPIHVDECCIDLLAFPGHKALLGPPGTGGLYVGPRAKLSPWREGGTGVFSELPLQPDEFPYALEAGSPNTLGLAGLRESLRFILQYGVEWIRTHELSLTERLLDGLRRQERCRVYGPSALEDRVAVVSLTLDGSRPDEVGGFLHRAHGIAVRTGLHCAPGAHRAIGTFPEGTIRISPGYFTTTAEIDRCLAALEEAAQQPSSEKREEERTLERQGVTGAFAGPPCDQGRSR
ncbi:MAG: aminotransferase class V-fold PLP-dependent enzyme [Candidatus Omnitrophica bacterium]|nr:aminotransferase class V-fold PLP-dependent enzyme [Candidatus Omnitrophota bacterium]